MLVKAKPWIPVLKELRQFALEKTGVEFNFALLNK